MNKNKKQQNEIENEDVLDNSTEEIVKENLQEEAQKDDDELELLRLENQKLKEDFLRAFADFVLSICEINILPKMSAKMIEIIIIICFLMLSPSPLKNCHIQI